MCHCIETLHPQSDKAVFDVNTKPRKVLVDYPEKKAKIMQTKTYSCLALSAEGDFVVFQAVPQF